MGTAYRKSICEAEDPEGQTLTIYRDEDGDRWYEFDNWGNKHLIAGSTFLGFTGSYTAMQRVSGQRREDGQLRLNTAVNDLVGSTAGADRARALIVII